MHKAVGEVWSPALRENVRQPISTNELQRRWAETRKAMAKAGIDCLVMQNSNQHLGGYVRWFTDLPAQYGYPRTVIFPAQDEMTLISHGGPPLPQSPPEWAARGVKERIGLPYLRTLNYTDLFDAEAIVVSLKARQAKRVGIVNKASMSATSYEYLQQNRGAIELVDATDLVDAIKAIKSPEELELIKKTAATQDAAWAAMPSLVRPGKKEYEILSSLVHLLTDMGSEEQLMSISSAPLGKPAGHKSSYFANRTLQAGDQLFVMIEANGPGGLYTELARTICLGDPSPELLKLWEVAKEAQKCTVGRLRPGAQSPELLKLHNEFMVGQGYTPEGRLFAHGQGYDLVERPGLRSEETIAIAANMNITVHPIAYTSTAFAFCCDNYVVEEHATVSIHKTAQKIFVI